MPLLNFENRSAEKVFPALLIFRTLVALTPLRFRIAPQCGWDFILASATLETIDVVLYFDQWIGRVLNCAVIDLTAIAAHR